MKVRLTPKRDFDAFVESHGRHPGRNEIFSIKRDFDRNKHVGDRVDFQHDGVWVVLEVLPDRPPPPDDPDHRLHVRMKTLDPDNRFVIDGLDGEEPWRP